MTLTSIRMVSITEAQLREIAPSVSSLPSSVSEGRYTAVASVQRADYSHLILEGRRQATGALQYFLREESGGQPARAGANSPDAGARLFLNFGEATITQIYYGDYDRDGHLDILLRLSNGSLTALTETPESAASSQEREQPPTDPYDPEPYDPEPTPSPATPPHAQAGSGGNYSSGPSPDSSTLSGPSGGLADPQPYISPSGKLGI